MCHRRDVDDFIVRVGFMIYPETGILALDEVVSISFDVGERYDAKTRGDVDIVSFDTLIRTDFVCFVEDLTDRVGCNQCPMHQCTEKM
jgi:hypothetical protein